MSRKPINDEQIIRALIETGGNQKQTAELLHISRKTIYNRFLDDDFCRAYDTAKREILQAIKDKINNVSLKALDRLDEILTNANTEYTTDEIIRASNITLRAVKDFNKVEIDNKAKAEQNRPDPHLVEEMERMLDEAQEEYNNTVRITGAEYLELKKIKGEPLEPQYLYREWAKGYRESEEEESEPFTAVNASEKEEREQKAQENRILNRRLY